MTRGVPMIDLKRDLAGATPEKLACALLRNRYPATASVPATALNEEM